MTLAAGSVNTIAAGPPWRNWQTRWIQNPVRFTPRPSSTLGGGTSKKIRLSHPILLISSSIFPRKISPNILKSAISDHTGYSNAAGVFFSTVKCPTHAKP